MLDWLEQSFFVLLCSTLRITKERSSTFRRHGTISKLFSHRSSRKDCKDLVPQNGFFVKTLAGQFSQTPTNDTYIEPTYSTNNNTVQYIYLQIIIMSSETTTTPTSMMMTTTLVVGATGATGATGKHVVQFLLDQGHTVKVVARSKERMRNLLSTSSHDDDKSYYGSRLQITETSILDLCDQELQDLVDGCDAVVSCLGHNLTLSGIWSQQTRRLVTDSVRRLTEAMSKDDDNSSSSKKKKFVLMGSDGVAAPHDNRRGWFDRSVLWLLRYLIPPHADNEQAAAYLLDMKNNKTTKNTTGTIIEWIIVRPTGLKEAEVSKFQLYVKPQGSLFFLGIATRANVAQFMVELVLNKDNQWEQYKYQMPVLHDVPVEEMKKGK
jgi:hypothetical protein